MRGSFLRRLSSLVPCVALVVGVGGCRKPSTDDATGAPSAAATTTTNTAPASAAPTPKAAKRRKARPPKPPEHLSPGPEALGRKARSEAHLRREGVVTNGALPVIDSASEAKLRSADAIIERALALVVVARKGAGLAHLEVVETRDALGAAAFLSPDEKDFVDDPSPSPTDKAQFAWRSECLGVMLWALGGVPELPRPAKNADPGALVKHVIDQGAARLREGAHLRPAKEILDAADLAYRYDWACVAARMTSEAPPKGVDCEVVVERHRALNWLIGYQGQEWDDVSTDT
jgi:hypothetical protein